MATTTISGKTRHTVLATAILTALISILALPAIGMFTGFDTNPAADAADTDVTGTQDMVTFDGNPAKSATTAVPEYMREDTRIRQHTTATASTSTNATGDANVTQNTSVGIEQDTTYRTGRRFDNVWITQDAATDVNQHCQTDGSCRQRADSNIRQHADVYLDQPFTNVFVDQQADARTGQDCHAVRCEQEADHQFAQETEFHQDSWGSNGFATRSHSSMWNADTETR